MKRLLQLLERGKQGKIVAESGSATRARAKRHTSRFLAVLAAVFLMGVSTASAADWYVDATGNDANSCTAPGPLMACATIQAAINKASAGDIIHVAAGLYPESAVTAPKIDRTLTLLGEQNGVDARGRVRQHLEASTLRSPAWPPSSGRQARPMNPSPSMSTTAASPGPRTPSGSRPRLTRTGQAL